MLAVEFSTPVLPSIWQLCAPDRREGFSTTIMHSDPAGDFSACPATVTPTHCGPCLCDVVHCSLSWVTLWSGQFLAPFLYFFCLWHFYEYQESLGNLYCNQTFCSHWDVSRRNSLTEHWLLPGRGDGFILTHTTNNIVCRGQASNPRGDIMFMKTKFVQTIKFRKDSVFLNDVIIVFIKLKNITQINMEWTHGQTL